MTARLLDQAGASAEGLVRLARLRPDWSERFDFSVDGFLRSFGGVLVALPFAVFATATIVPAEQTHRAVLLWASGFAHVIEHLAYPLAMAVVCRAFGARAGYPGFVVTVNWASCWLNVALAGVALLALASRQAAALVGMLLYSVLMFLTWRAARETLTGEVGLSLLAVLLAFGAAVASEFSGVAVALALGPSS